MTLLARSTMDPTKLTDTARITVRSVDAEQPIYDLNPMDQVVADSFGPKRLTLFLLVFLSAVALVLACTGLFATLSYSVGQRQRELGIRLAVGAKSYDIFRLVISDGAQLAFAGVTLGLLAAFALTRLMSTLLYEVNASDPVILLGTAAILVTVALLASYVPARRATQVDPTTVLRSE